MDTRLGNAPRRIQIVTRQSLIRFCLALACCAWAVPNFAADVATSSPSSIGASDEYTANVPAQKSALPGNGDPRPQDEFWMISTRHLGGCQVKDDAELAPQVFRNGDGWHESEVAEFLDTQKMADKLTIFFIHGNRQSINDAENEGRLVYRRLLEARPHMQPLRFVIWSWPSERIRGLVRDIREKARRADVHAVYLGRLLAQLEEHAPQSLQISIIAYSYGTRLALGALHLWGGGTLCGTQLDRPANPHHLQARVTLLAAAEHNYWLMPGSYHSEAYGRIDHLVNMRNSRDPVLKRYWMLDGCGRPRAMGYTGIAGLSQLPDGGRKVERYNIAQKTHALDAYFYYDYFVEQMRRCVLWDRIDEAE